MPKINRISIANFRGIVDQTVELSGKSLVLLGENGTGKSSLVDAIEFYFKSSVDHLESVQGISTARHAPHIKAGKKDLAVHIQFKDFDGEYCRTLTRFDQIPDYLTDFHRQGSSMKFILRRKELLNFILVTPADRYAQLASIIGIDEFDEVERSFMQIKERLNSEKKENGFLVENDKVKLKSLLELPEFSAESMLSKINEKVKTLGLKPLNSLENTQKLISELFSIPVRTQNIQLAIELDNALSKISELSQNTSILQIYSQLDELVAELKRDKSILREILLQDVLKSSYRFLFEYDDVENCPVCLNPVNRSELIGLLNERIEKNQAISKKLDDVKGKKDELTNAISIILENIASLKGMIIHLGISFDFVGVEKVADEFTALKKLLNPEIESIKLMPLDEFQCLLSSLGPGGSLQKLVQELKNEKDKLSISNQDTSLIGEVQLINTVLESYENLTNNQKRYSQKEEILNEFESILQAFVATKKIEVQKIYTEIQESIESYMRFLHTSEECSHISLDVTEGRRASTEIKADFFDVEQQDPRAFYSEGHLDSLGLCIFLAFVKNFNNGFPIIILDDVVSSIDSSHRKKICDLIFTELPDIQWIITTHDYVWYAELLSYQQVNNMAHKFVNCQIVNWSLENGCAINKYLSNWEKIDKLLNLGDRDGAAAAVRKELEGFLYELVINLKVSVPINRANRYTVAELESPLLSFVKRKLPKYYQEKESIIKAMLDNKIFGNFLVHNNPDFGNCSIEEIKSFAKALNDFESIFICKACGRIIQYFKDANVIKCNCKGNGILIQAND